MGNDGEHKVKDIYGTWPDMSDEERHDVMRGLSFDEYVELLEMTHEVPLSVNSDKMAMEMVKARHPKWRKSTRR